ncbi:MAG: biotin--[acetyl-CoA-carboxylase] ligase [Chloroflexi bacterium]|nr:biotin--[acetyl-CoA-carboxylase] ligase [Chloroflexota bacterium]
MTPWDIADRPRRRVGRGLELHDEIPSTNDRARELLAEPDGEGRAVVAEVQTAGRGRRGRTWTSPGGVNLAVSVGLQPRLSTGDAWQLAAAAALAAWDACNRFAPVTLKWPNDVVADFDGAKVGGILIETTLDGERVAEAVIGIGLNLNWARRDMPAELAGATSLAELAGGPVDRGEVLDGLLDALDDEIVALEAGHTPRDRYRAACSTLGREVELETGEGRIHGRAVDIDERGELVLETSDGTVHVASGEIARLRTAVPA